MRTVAARIGLQLAGHGTALIALPTVKNMLVVPTWPSPEQLAFTATDDRASLPPLPRSLPQVAAVESRR